MGLVGGAKVTELVVVAVAPVPVAPAVVVDVAGSVRVIGVPERRPVTRAVAFSVDPAKELKVVTSLPVGLLAVAGAAVEVVAVPLVVVTVVVPLVLPPLVVTVVVVVAEVGEVASAADAAVAANALLNANNIRVTEKRFFIDGSFMLAVAAQDFFRLRDDFDGRRGIDQQAAVPAGDGAHARGV